MTGCDQCRTAPAVVHLTAGPDYKPDPTKPLMGHDLCLPCSISILTAAWDAGLSKAGVGHEPWINRHRHGGPT